MVKGCWPHAQDQAGGPPLVVCPQLITSIAGGHFSIHNPRMRHAVVTGTPPNMGIFQTQYKLIVKLKCKLIDLIAFLLQSSFRNPIQFHNWIVI
jgi:hypothetical protein